jgi:16S rRNA (cytosine967-C5)-methyltransferase
VSIFPAIIQHAESLLGEVLKFEYPADAVTTRYFRSHGKIGHRDRGTIAEAVFAALRHKLEFAQLAQSGSGPLTRRLTLLGLAYVAGMEAVIAKVGPAEAEWLKRISTVDRMTLPLETRCNLPGWLFDALGKRFDNTELEQLCNALNRPAPLDLRANVIKATRENALSNLAAVGVKAAPTPFSPLGIRLANKPALQNLTIFADGGIEVQDEGSQLLAHLVAPKRGELVIDFCAGAGGKTLALGALMRSTGRLYAVDVSAARLAKLKPRLARSGLSNVHPVTIDSEHDPKLRRLAGKADRVLVDAPCSGLGTLRRNPDLKWRQSPQTIREMALKQSAILEAAARLVKPGGRLVYATCSLLEDENEQVTGKFLDSTPGFEFRDATEILRAQQIPLDTGATLKLWPHRHGTDGFFAAVFQRTS